MSTAPVTLDDFLTAAADGGPAIALKVVDARTRVPSADLDGVLVRRLDAREARTLPSFYRAVAKAWDFPKHFGANKDAFDDAMTDLPDAERGYLTEITHPAALLERDADDLEWFTGSVEFYAGEYGPGRQFGVVLLAAEDEVAATRTAWTAAGAELVVVE
ncbi:MAG: barstar family protein [Gordonia sp. (in: high G+C Gram-positive bacteria)]|uniref:barstar family protein n=1 Tax=Gordonia sp. (in: high G+C Gram-positive bacteria) TaxID=84139 RepID=UPI0039E60D59